MLGHPSRHPTTVVTALAMCPALTQSTYRSGVTGGCWGGGGGASGCSEQAWTRDMGEALFTRRALSKSIGHKKHVYVISHLPTRVVVGECPLSEPPAPPPHTQT